ncbi:MAG TPA: hypothetical protein VEA81_16175, partial [Burkholderiaceae bacterium]|nr:hypothetical protein [Burkholderiaceae bacterium]
MGPSDAKTAEYKPPAPAAGATAASTPRARRQSEGAQAPLIPDTCNLGIVLRTLVPLNLLAMLAAIAATTGPYDAATRFLSMAAHLEPVALGSLVGLCLARKVVNGMRHAVQWTVALGLPAALSLVASLVLHRLNEPGLAGSELVWWTVARVAVAAVVAWLFVEYFRLRARAFSPSFSEARLQALQA